MTVPHHHPHRTDVSLSLLRVSAQRRLMLAGVIIAGLWAALYWVMR